MQGRAREGDVGTKWKAGNVAQVLVRGCGVRRVWT